MSGSEIDMGGAREFVAQETRMPLSAKLALIATLFAGVVVMLGAWTRLVDAGLGCPDWPGCYGFLTVPNESHEIAIAEQRFPASPVEVEKGWPEMIHRYFAGTLGLLILGLTVLAYSRKNEQQGFNLPRGHLTGLLVLVVCQAAFGMWTVTLKLWPQVVSAHLLGGFATLSLLFLLFLRMNFPGSLAAGALPVARSSLPIVVANFRRMSYIALGLLIAQIFLGAWTASNYAALACGDELPGCQGSLWPEMDFAMGFNFLQTIGPNYLGGLLDDQARVAIQMAHRIGAVVVTCYFAWLLLRLKKLTGVPLIRASVWALGVVLAVQVLLGLSNVIWLIPLSIAVAHNAVGALLLLALVNLIFQLGRIK